MEFLKEWTLCVCITLIISCIFSLFTPKGSMKNFYKIVISIFIFISFLYPLKDFKNLNFDFVSADIGESVNTSTENTYEEMINNNIKKVLSENDVIGADVSSRISFDLNSGEISVKSVQVAVSDEYSKDDVGQIIFDTLGINARVIHIGE